LATSSRRYQLFKATAKILGKQATRSVFHMLTFQDQILKKKPILALRSGPRVRSLFKANTKRYIFDVNKTDQIFGFLMKKQIHLSSNYGISSTEELKNEKLCKRHNSKSCNTNRVFYQQIQSADRQKRIHIDRSR